MAVLVEYFAASGAGDAEYYSSFIDNSIPSLPRYWNHSLGEWQSSLPSSSAFRRRLTEDTGIPGRYIDLVTMTGTSGRVHEYIYRATTTLYVSRRLLSIVDGSEPFTFLSSNRPIADEFTWKLPPRVDVDPFAVNTLRMYQSETVAAAMDFSKLILPGQYLVDLVSVEQISGPDDALSFTKVGVGESGYGKLLIVSSEPGEFVVGMRVRNDAGDVLHGRGRLSVIE